MFPAASISSSSTSNVISRFTTSQSENSHQELIASPTREQIWDLRKNLADSSNVETRDFANQLAELHHLIDHPTTDRKTFISQFLELFRKLWSAAKNGTISRKEYDIACQDLRAQAKLFRDIHLETDVEAKITAFANAIDRNDAEAIKKILMAVSSAQKN